MKISLKKINLGLVVTIVLVMMCLVAFIIAIDISITVSKNENNSFGKLSNKEKKKIENPVPINIVNSSNFYYNGIKTNEIKSFLISSGNLCFALDDILEKLNIPFEYYASDDIFETDVEGKKVTIKLGAKEFYIDGEKFPVKVPSLTYRDSLLVVKDLLLKVGNFEFDESKEMNSIFMCYYNNFAFEKLKGLKLIKIYENKLEIVDFEEKEKVIEKNVDPQNLFIKKNKKNSYIIGSKDFMYYVKENKITRMNGESFEYADFSMDGKLIHWVDISAGKSYVFDISTEKTISFGDYFLRIKNNNNNLNDIVLKEFYSKDKTKFICYIDRKNQNEYSFVESDNSLLYEGDVKISPDKTQLINKSADGLYYITDLSGKNKKILGNGDYSDWIGNSKILVKNSSAVTIYDRDTLKKTRYLSQWGVVGILDDFIFYKGENNLYWEYNKKSEKICSLPYDLSVVIADKPEGPYVLLPVSEQDDVLYLAEGKMQKIEKKSSVIKNSEYIYESEQFSDSIIFSPNNRGIAVLVNNNGLLSINILDVTGKEQNYVIGAADNILKTGAVRLNWIDDKKIVVYSSKNLWFLDFSSDIKIFKWNEENKKEIRGIIKAY